MMKKLKELLKEKEGLDLNEKDLIVRVHTESDAEKVLNACKEAGMRWASDDEIDPAIDARDKKLFSFPSSGGYYVAIDRRYWEIYRNRCDFINENFYHQLDSQRFIQYVNVLKKRNYRLSELLKKYEGFDPYKRDIVIRVSNEKMMRAMLSVMKNMGFDWVNGEIEPEDDARDLMNDDDCNNIIVKIGESQIDSMYNGTLLSDIEDYFPVSEIDFLIYAHSCVDFEGYKNEAN